MKALGQMPEWAQYVVQILMQALRERDPYTYGHCRRVSRNARLLAAAAGLSQEEQTIVEFGSVFHDIGKMGIPDEILLKPGRLTDDQEKVMREHPVKSAEIIAPLEKVPFFKSVVPGVLHHHERIDGLGYPFGLKGEQIPLHARIILIADTFDAMTTSRPYRKGLAQEVAYKELRIFSGRQFDPHLVKIFMEAHPRWDAFEEEISEQFIARHFKKTSKAA